MILAAAVAAAIGSKESSSQGAPAVVSVQDKDD